MDQDDKPESVVLSINQQGGQTAHTIINQAPAPTATLGQTLSANEQDDAGKFHNRAEILVTSPYPAANLYVEAHGASVESVELMPQRGGAFMTWPGGGTRRLRLQQSAKPHGLVHADVVSRDHEAHVSFVTNVE